MYHTIPFLKFYKVIADKQQQKNVPAHSMWKLLCQQLTERHCFRIDYSGVNKNSHGRYRTQADNPEKQVCYFNKPHDDKLYNVFISKRIKTENFSNSIYFKIDRVQGKYETFDAEKTLKQDSAHDRFSKFDTDPEPDFNGRVRVRKQGYEETFEHSNGRTRKSARPRFLSRR